MRGSGNLEVTNAINGAELAITLSGSGSVKGTATLKNFTGELSGSGNITFAGKSENATLTLSGSGNFNGKDFSIKKAAVQISGSANVHFKATEMINAVISGSGNVSYSGDPVVKKRISGSGRVSKR